MNLLLGALVLILVLCLWKSINITEKFQDNIDCPFDDLTIERHQNGYTLSGKSRNENQYGFPKNFKNLKEVKDYLVYLRANVYGFQYCYPKIKFLNLLSLKDIDVLTKLQKRADLDVLNIKERGALRCYYNKLVYNVSLTPDERALVKNARDNLISGNGNDMLIYESLQLINQKLRNIYSSPEQNDVYNIETTRMEIQSEDKMIKNYQELAQDAPLAAAISVPSDESEWVKEYKSLTGNTVLSKDSLENMAFIYGVRQQAFNENLTEIQKALIQKQNLDQSEQNRLRQIQTQMFQYLVNNELLSKLLGKSSQDQWFARNEMVLSEIKDKIDKLELRDYLTDMTEWRDKYLSELSHYNKDLYYSLQELKDKYETQSEHRVNDKVEIAKKTQQLADIKKLFKQLKNYNSQLVHRNQLLEKNDLINKNNIKQLKRNVEFINDINRINGYGYTYNLIPTNSYYLSPLFETESTNNAGSSSDKITNDNIVAQAIENDIQTGGDSGDGKVSFYYSPYYRNLLANTVVRPVVARSGEEVADISGLGFH